VSESEAIEILLIEGSPGDAELTLMHRLGLYWPVVNSKPPAAAFSPAE
jgi:hypothetical protein